MVKVKICGLSRVLDIEAVNRALPDYIGFVFAPSRRRVDVETAAMLKQKLDARIKAVGIFVNEDIDNAAEIYKEEIIDIVQLHGDEDDDYIRHLKEKCGCPVIKAVGVGDALPSLPTGSDYLMFDTLSAQRGGGGTAFDWNILKGYGGSQYFLAGGISIENVIGAIQLLAPYCVDISSGVETDGAKDAEKIEKFVNTVRGIK